jgi:ankyrin repeat protein
MDYPHQIDNTLIKIVLNSVQDGDLSVIKQNAIKFNLDMNLLVDKDSQQNAFFFMALVKNDIDALNICKYLVEIGVNPLHKDKHNQTCLYYTVREGKYETSKYLIEGCNLPINERDIYGQNPIYYAARDGHLNLCELLVEKGTDVNLEDKYGQTCIFYAIREGHYDIVDFLIKHGANVNKNDKKKQTPVSFAMKNNKDKIAELLIANGGIRPEPKTKNNKEHNKRNRKKSVEEEHQTKSDIINNIQAPKKYILVKIGDNGEKTPLTEEECEKFAQENPEVFQLLNNKEELKKKVDEINDEDLKMHDSWEKIAKKLMNTLWKHRDADLFHKPVDPEELNIPDYFNIIKNPMDFSTIKKKLSNYSYTNLKEFCNDMGLVFENCYTYNGRKTMIGDMCTRVKKEYEKLFEELKLKKFM